MNDNNIIETTEITRKYSPERAAMRAERERRQKQQFKKAVKRCVALALTFGLISGGTFAGINHLSGSSTSSSGSTSSGTTATATSTSSSADLVASTSDSGAATVYDVSDLTAECMPSIVAITCVSEEEYMSMFGQAQTAESESAGSGILIAEDDDYLYIATNNHVVSGVTSLTVTFSDDSTATGTVKGTDSENDLAVVMVDKSQLTDDTKSAIKIATLGDSTDLSIGSSVMAIGNALGIGQSVTTGVISALDRQVATSDSSTGETVTSSLIQTDAAINPGNSGGALFNMDGEVIGINSSKYSSTEVEGMGYAIPISTAAPILSSIIKDDSSDSSSSDSSDSSASSDSSSDTANSGSSSDTANSGSSDGSANSQAPSGSYGGSADSQAPSGSGNGDAYTYSDDGNGYGYSGNGGAYAYSGNGNTYAY